MDDAIITGLFALAGSAFGSSVTLLIQKQTFKTEFMVEKRVKQLLRHEKFVLRSFDTIKSRIGGFDKDEDALRRILVRAGAVRVIGKNNSEWWRLSSRFEEKDKL